MKSDVVVLGGGIIGALSAYELSKSGLKVALIDKHAMGSGASGNSAAMLELQIDAYRKEPFFSLAKASHDLFPALHQELLKKTKVDFQFKRCSILQVALTKEEAVALEKECVRQKGMGLRAEWISKDEVSRRWPGLSKNQFGGAHFLDDGQVKGSNFVLAALEGARMHGAVLQENVDTLTIARCMSIASKVVVAGGAWADEILAEVGVKFGIKPVRGQLAVFDTPTPPLPFPVYTKTGGYITPKFDGTTLAGSTIEDVGFAQGPTDEGRAHITNLVKTLMPSLLERPLIKMTAGLRPKSPDHLPILGPLAQRPEIFVASGHYRNGFLLAPITAQLVKAWATGQPYPVAIDPFLPSRVYSKA